MQPTAPAGSTGAAADAETLDRSKRNDMDGSMETGKRQNDGLVVFSILRQSTCAECGVEIGRGEFLRMEQRQPLCLICADLDDLVFLARGDTALTRRATRHSALSAVVVRFSRSRKRYERQGVLVEEVALARAETECLADADAQALARDRAGARRDRIDANYVRDFAEHVGELFPGCPAVERRTIAEHACLKHSGRVGRSTAARHFELEAIELAVQAHVRHQHTNYDQLLGSGCERLQARAAVRSAVEGTLRTWQRNNAV
jgi:hypothetical protein